MALSLWILSGILFTTLTVTLGVVSLPYYKKENSDKMWRVYGMRARYWQAVVLVSALLTMLLMYSLKWMSIISF